MSTLRRAMRWVASTSARVSVGSSPSGTIATMMPIAKMKSFQNGTPTIQPIAKNDQLRSGPPAVRSSGSSRAISVLSGETALPAVCVSRAILPNSVCMPVAKTTALAWPDTIEVPASRMFLLRIRLVGSGRRCVAR